MPEPKLKPAAPIGLLCLVMIVVGVAMTVRTIAAGGGPLSLGVILGVLFVAAGAGRLYIGRVTRG